MTLRTGMPILPGGTCGTDRPRRTDVARSAVAAGRTGRTHRAWVAGRADGSDRTLVNWDFQDIVEAQTDVLVNRGAPCGPGSLGNCCDCGGNRFRHHFSWVFMFSSVFMFAGFWRFGHSGLLFQSSPLQRGRLCRPLYAIYLLNFSAPIWLMVIGDGFIALTCWCHPSPTMW